jgi:hypothetical protein
MAAQLGGLGFVPIIVAALSLAAQNKAAKDANKYGTASNTAASEQAIASGQAVSPASLMTAADKSFLAKVWSTVRVAAQWSDINWGAIGYSRGPLISAAANQVMSQLWPDIRVAAQFSHINWNAHAIPVSAAQQIAPNQFMAPNYLDPVMASENRKLILAAGIGGAALLLGLALRN